MKKETIIPVYDQILVETMKSVNFSGEKFAICTLTTPDFVGGKACPFTGRVQKFEYRFSTWNGNYRTAIINKLVSKAGMTQEEAVAEFERKESKSNYNRVAGMLQSLKSDERKLYVSLIQNSADLVGNRTRYIIDGRFATKDEETAIKAAIRPKASSNARLDAVGIKDEDQIVYNTIKLENVKYFKQGNKFWKCNYGLNHPDQTKSKATM